MVARIGSGTGLGLALIEALKGRSQGQQLAQQRAEREERKQRERQILQMRIEAFEDARNLVGQENLNSKHF